MDFKNFFFLFLFFINLSNNDIISWRQGLKSGIEASSVNGRKNDIFWSKIGSGFGENPREYSPGYLGSRFVFVSALSFKSYLLSAIYTWFPWYSRIKWYTGSAGSTGRPGATWTPGKRRCKRITRNAGCKRRQRAGRTPWEEWTTRN